MFEFTEDRKGIRPMYVGTIKNKYLRRLAMIATLIPLWVVVFSFNTARALLAAFLVLWVHSFWAGLKMIYKSIFTKWEFWDEPRKPNGK